MLNTDLHQYSWGGQFIWIGFQFLDALHPFTVLECSNKTNFQLNDVSSTKKMLIIFSQEARVRHGYGNNKGDRNMQYHSAPLQRRF